MVVGRAESPRIRDQGGLVTTRRPNWCKAEYRTLELISGAALVCSDPPACSTCTQTHREPNTSSGFCILASQVLLASRTRSLVLPHDTKLWTSHSWVSTHFMNVVHVQLMLIFVTRIRQLSVHLPAAGCHRHQMVIFGWMWVVIHMSGQRFDATVSWMKNTDNSWCWYFIVFK